jgi:hypothetical protein
MQPQRIQRKRTTGFKMPVTDEGTVYVGRPTKWGNPYRVVYEDGAWFVVLDGNHFGSFETKGQAVSNAVDWYLDYLSNMQPAERDELFSELRGKNLSCWCPLDQPCHADVLLELANQSGV